MPRKPEYTVLKKWMLSTVGLFVKEIKENNEMLYQNNSDYLFDSTKFEKAFNYQPISYEEGITATVKSMRD